MSGQDFQIKVAWEVSLRRQTQDEGWPRSLRTRKDGPRIHPYLIRVRLTSDGTELSYGAVRVDGNVIGPSGRPTSENAHKTYWDNVPQWLEDLLADGLTRAEQGHALLSSHAIAGQRFGRPAADVSLAGNGPAPLP